MTYQQLPFWIKLRARKNKRKYWKGIGLPELADDTQKNGELLHMFDFSNTPEGFNFWSMLDHFSSMEEVRSLPNYQNFIKTRNSKIYYKITWIASMIFYAVMIYFLLKSFAPPEFWKIFLIR